MTLARLGLIVIALGLGAPRTVPAAESRGDAVLLDDDFHSMRSGPLGDVVDAELEYHYLPSAAPKGNWAVSTFASSTGFQRAWQIIDFDGTKSLRQTFVNDRFRYTHPEVVAGDRLWKNYTLRVDFAPKSADGRSGIAFGYQNDRCYYFFGVESRQVVLLMVQHETAFHKPFEKVLAKAAAPWPSGEMLHASVRFGEGQIEASLNDRVSLHAQDKTYSAGKVALLADVPTVYRHVRVTATPDEYRLIQSAIMERESTEKRLQDANPKLKVWKRLKTENFGTGRNLRFGDLDHDGQVDILFGQVRHHGPKDRFSELSCLTAMNLDGRILWQIGEPDPWKYHLTNDVAFQIQDIDGDGRNEVVYAMNQELIVADGATGKTKYKTPTPPALPIEASSEWPSVPKPKFPRVLGDSLLICDLRGRGWPGDLVLKDRYHHVWTYDFQLKPLWHATCNTGHYPYATDIDGDGKDELLVGYSLFDDDGTKLWSVQKEIRDHADAVAIVKLKPGEHVEPNVVCVASDEGMFVATLQGKILKHHRVGHAQNLTIANFRDDLPGLEILSMNFWGNQGIVHLYDSNGDIYHDFEPCQYGSLCLPVNWTGRSEEFFLLTPNPEDGGLFDGHGRRVVRFPADGHPDMCNAVLDLTGDGRDEIVVWDPYELWIYTQADGPQPGRIYKPRRNPLWTESNYRATISEPGWSIPTAHAPQPQ